MLKRHVHTGTCLRCLPIFVGGHSGVMFEKAHKVLRVFKAEPRTDLLKLSVGRRSKTLWQ